MNCYGFPFEIYFELLSKAAYIPGNNIFYNTNQGPPDTTYNPSAPFLGFGPYFNNTECYTNQNLIQANTGYPDWLSPINNKVDLRAAYV